MNPPIPSGVPVPPGQDPRPVPSPPWPGAVAASVLLAVGLSLSLDWTRADQELESQATATAPAAQPRGPAKGQKAVVPFEMLPTNHMLVRARINGKGPFRLIFDLGAPITLLGNRASEDAGVVKPDAPRSFLMGMRGEAEINQ